MSAKETGFVSLGWAARRLEESNGTTRKRFDQGEIDAIRLEDGTRIPRRESVERLAASKRA